MPAGFRVVESVFSCMSKKVLVKYLKYTTTLLKKMIIFEKTSYLPVADLVQ